MPVIGLTDRESLKPRFPRLGKLRKGGAKPDRGFGKDLDHFRFTSDQEDVVNAFVKAYGQQPSHLDVYLPYATADENFETWMEEWSAGGLVHRCDGKTMNIWRKDDGTYEHGGKPCPFAGGKQRTKEDPGCHIVGRLAVILPHLLRAGHVGYVVLETHSNHDLRNIMATLMAVCETRPEGLQGIPFTLRRYKETISTPSGSNGGRARREKSLVALVPTPTWVESRMALAQAEAFAALPAGDTLIINETNGDFDDDDDDDFDPATGEIFESAPTKAVASQTQKKQTVSTKGAVRPLEPEQLREFLQTKAIKTGSLGPATDKQVPFLARKFQECFAGEDDAQLKYHSCLLWIWNKESARDLTLAEAKATLDWLLAKAPDDTGDIPLHEHAPEEARRVLRIAMLDAGQTDMFDAPTPEDDDIPWDDDVEEVLS